MNHHNTILQLIRSILTTQYPSLRSYANRLPICNDGKPSHAQIYARSSNTCSLKHCFIYFFCACLKLELICRRRRRRRSIATLLPSVVMRVYLLYNIASIKNSPCARTRFNDCIVSLAKRLSTVAGVVLSFLIRKIVVYLNET